MEYYCKNAFNDIKEIGVALKHCKIGNIEAADQICKIICSVIALDYGGRAAEEALSVKKEFEVK